MNTSQIYISIGIVVLLIIGAVVFFLRKYKTGQPLSTLASLALMFVLAGIIFGDDRVLGYSLIGIGVAMAIFDIIQKFNKK